MIQHKGFTGISFPFRFNSSGGVETTSTSPSDLAHIEESVYQIIKTNIGERVMESFGSELLDSLFENIEDPSNLGMLKYDIINAITRHDNRVEVKQVNFVIEDSTIIANIDIYVKKYLVTSTVKVPFEKSSLGGEF